MAAIDRIARVSIALRTAGVRVRTFSDLMLIGAHSAADRVSVITGADELLASGTFNVATTSALYKAALTAFSQNPGPSRIFIGKRNSGEAINVTLAACAAENTEWYGFSDVTHAVADALIAAAWAEANEKLYLTTISQDGAITTADDDLATALMDGNYFRTAWWYHPDAAQFPEVATAVKAFAATPGGGGQVTNARQFFLSDLWSERQLAGVTVVPMTETAYINVRDKNGNTFEPFRNINITQRGMTAGGEWIDIIRGRDWQCELIRTNVFQRFIERRLPFTDAGIAVIEGAVVDALERGKLNGFLAPETLDSEDNRVPSYTVTVPRETDVSVNDKAARILRNVSFTARLAGAIIATEITGVLTYDVISEA